MNMLDFELFGEGNTGDTVVIAHGLFGSRKNWRTIAKIFSQTGRKIVVVDMRNHGNSFWSDSHSYEDLGYDLKHIIRKFGDKADLIGHSMGGKGAMALALTSTETIRKLVVVDISPVNYTHDWSDYISAMQSVDFASIANRKDLDDQLKTSIGDSGIRSFLIQSADISNESGSRWLMNLASLQRNLPNIMGFPHFKTTNVLPCLFIRGSISTYVLDRHLPLIRKYFPNVKLNTIDRAGHWVHAERKEEFCKLVLSFLDGVVR